MKLFLTTLVVALAGVASATHLSRDVYPCPHSGTSRLAHLSSCSKFVQCVNGVAVEESCASGLFFNAELQQCTWASLANCNVERNPCPTWTDPENLVFLANGANCNNYFMCFDGHPLSMNCASGLSFNRNLDQCDYVQCFTSHWSCGVNGLFPDDSDCSRYYHCFNGVQYARRCPEGEAFDTQSSRCVDSRLASCGIFTTVPTTTASTANSTVSCAPTCTTPSWPTTWSTPTSPNTTWTTGTSPNTTWTTPTSPNSTWTTGTSPNTTRTTPTTTLKTTTTHKPHSTTTKKPHYTTTEKTTTTHRPHYTTTQKPATTTTQKSTTTHKPHTTTTQAPVTLSTTTPAAITTTAEPGFNADNYCKTSDVGLVAVVAHPERCDWYIQCVFGRGTVGHCHHYQIFNPKKGHCVYGSQNTCKFADDVEEQSAEHFVAIEAGLN